jgi:hypothetical protein
MKNKELTTTTNAAPAFNSQGGFETAQRIAQALSMSNLVPSAYQDNLPNCLVAIEYASRVGMSVLAVMQNLHVIHGKPSPSSTFIIAAINTCGRFTPLQYKMTGEGDQRGCIAFSYDKQGNLLESPLVSMAMAKAEGWSSKKGSKWITMPDLMLRYRAAAFFGRLYAPEIVLGMHTVDEQRDIQYSNGNQQQQKSSLNDLIKDEEDATIEIIED